MKITRVESEGIELDKFLGRVERVERENGIRALALDEGAVSGEDQVRAAIMHAERNFSKGKNVARDFKTEIMRYIACERQIKDAIEKAGIKEGTRAFILVLLDPADEKKVLRSLKLKKSGFINEKRDKVDEALEGMALLDL